jgi:hypothetical protein
VLVGWDDVEPIHKELTPLGNLLLNVLRKFLIDHCHFLAEFFLFQFNLTLLGEMLQCFFEVVLESVQYFD